MASRLIFRQLFDARSSTYTYILGCHNTRKALLIDPVIDNVKRDAEFVRQLDLDLIFGLNTHLHADHITGTGALKQFFPHMKTVLSVKAGGKADWLVDEGDYITVGEAVRLEVLSTPGHTDGCLSYVSNEHKMVFTGDALLIRGCGRTDFQNGSAERLYDSVHNKLFTLPANYSVFPAHDYKGVTQSSIGEEIRWNPRLCKPKEEFIEIMANLNLPYPKQIDAALPANKACGLYEITEKAKEELNALD